MASKPSADDAVRNYLLMLNDPDQLRDDKEVKRLEGQLAKTTDPVERVKLQQQIRDASHPPKERYEREFITHAKDWSQRHGVSERAFIAEGVKEPVLRRAGFTNVRGARSNSTRRRSGNQTGRTRVSAQQIRDSLPHGEFTIKDAQRESGASEQVVRRVVQEAVKDGSVADLGPKQDHAGPGRAPRSYKR